MMKRLLTVVLLLAVATGLVFAQAKTGGLAREVAMGGSNTSQPGLVLNPFIMNDPSLLLLNPAYASKYSDYVWWNLGGGTLSGLSTGDNGYGKQSAGINIAFSKEWTFGAILSYDPSAVNVVSQLLQNQNFGGVGGIPGFAIPTIERVGRTPQAIPAVNNVFEALTSYNLGAMDVGFGVMLGWASNTTNASATNANATPPQVSNESEASARLYGFRGGILFDLGGGSMLDASATLRIDKATDKISSNPLNLPPVANSGEYSVSGTELQLAARASLKMSNKINFVPYGWFSTISAEPKEDTTPDSTATAKFTAPLSHTAKYSALSLGLGVGGEYHTANAYLAGGISYQYVRAKVEVATPVIAGASTSTTYTASASAIPVFNLGAEWWFTDWFAGRAGYYRALASITAKFEGSATAPAPIGNSSATSEISQPFANSAVILGSLPLGNDPSLATLGIGLKFGGFSLDATVSEEALRRGFGLIGAQDNINSFGLMTASFTIE